MPVAQSPVRGLVFGAFMAALTVVLQFASIIPGVPLLLPLPTALAAVRFGPRTAALSGTVAILAAAMVVGWVEAFSWLLVLGVAPGLVLGWCLRRGLPAMRTALFTGVTAMAGLLLVSTLGLAVAGIDYRAQMERALSQATAALEQRLDRWQERGWIRPEDRPRLEQRIQEMAKALPYLLPSILAMSVGMMSFVTYLLASLVFPRLGHPVAPLPPFAHWQLPPWLNFVFLPVLLILGIPNLPPAAVQVGQALAPALAMLYQIQGMAVGAWWLHHRAGLTPKAATWVAVLGTVLGGQAMGLVAMALGLLDFTFDFRQLRTRVQPG